ncbi:MAG: hypothetical protein U0822_25375 [Anaerolineae bacterium]
MEVPSYFRRYLQAIQPARANRTRAVQLHNTLRDRLGADQHFKDWFAGTFLYGSYRRNTAVQPIKDVDICILLNINPADHKPEAVVARLRRVLERNGYQDKTALQRRSIRVEMSGMTLDAVPVVQVNGPEEPLLIPDRPLAQWVPTHPKGHLAAATALNKENGGRFIPFVKIVKAWYRYQAHDLRAVERPKPKGFTLEALVAKYQDADAPSYAEAFVTFLDNLWRDAGQQLKHGVFPDVADPGMPGETLKLTFDPEEVELFTEIVTESLVSAQSALEATTYKDSAALWGTVLGSKFPKAERTMPEDEVKRVAETEEIDEALDEEIGGIELPQVHQLGTLKIRAQVARTRYGETTQGYPSDSRALPKGFWLRFSIVKTSVLQPYSVRWIVNNHGREAREAGDLGHMQDGDSEEQWEYTKYRGVHTMTCELHRNGAVLARAKHIVNIK